MQICEVCGKKFRTLNLNHLRTHAIISWDQYEDLVQTRKKPDQTILREVAHSLLHRQTVPEGHARKLAKIKADVAQCKPGINAVTDMRQLIRLIRLMEKMEKLEGTALDEDKFAEYTLEQLLELMKFTSADIEKIIKQLSGEAQKSGYSVAVENVLQYNLVHATGTGTDFDARLPTDPRAHASLMQRVEEFLGQFRQGKAQKPEVIDVTAVKPTDSDRPGE